MIRLAIIPAVLCLALFPLSATGAQFATDTFPTAAGELAITFIGHGTLMLQWGGKTIHVDPVGEYADFTQFPKADLIFVTHEHRDHLDPKALAAVRTDTAVVILTRACAGQVQGGLVMGNGESAGVGGIAIDAVPAYNIANMRSPGDPYHPKGQGNGYILTLGGKRVYVAGDSENTPEMKALKNIDIAFLPMNLPNTMTLEMVADAASTIKPKVLYPYHYRDTDTGKLVALLKDAKEIEVRIRNLK
jgi:L-ascorbate metabolism protein UlaG (beta-lactamase superfamily)